MPTYNGQHAYIHNRPPTHTYKTKTAYTLKVPDNLDLAAAAPLLCAGITVWSPFVHYGVRSHHAVGVVGLGGLGK